MLNRHGLVEDSKTVAPDSHFEKSDGPDSAADPSCRMQVFSGILRVLNNSIVDWNNRPCL